ncbi:MAG: hypothetical protein ICV83_14810 [Cytophagales bacterium]|nr:hypothetical protein [Cytophagales bacterium]
MEKIENKEISSTMTVIKFTILFILISGHPWPQDMAQAAHFRRKMRKRQIKKVYLPIQAKTAGKKRLGIIEINL